MTLKHGRFEATRFPYNKIVSIAVFNPAGKAPGPKRYTSLKSFKFPIE